MFLAFSLSSSAMSRRFCMMRDGILRNLSSRLPIPSKMIPITQNNRRVSGVLSISLVSMEMQSPSRQAKLLPRAAPSWMYDAYSNKSRQQQIKQTSCCAREIISLRVVDIYSPLRLGFTYQQSKHRRIILRKGCSRKHT